MAPAGCAADIPRSGLNLFVSPADNHPDEPVDPGVAEHDE
jgi:hypothetical protein